jgi:hypothetical protein
VNGELPVQGQADIQFRVVPVDPALGTDSSDGHHWTQDQMIRVK